MPGHPRETAPLLLRRAGALAWLMAMQAAPLAAQQWQVDMGGSRIRYDTTGAISLLAITPQLEWNGRDSYGLLTGTLAGFEGGEWSTQGQGGLAHLGRLGNTRFGLEVAGTIGGTLHTTGQRTAATRGQVRFRYDRPQAGVWGGIAGGTGWNSSSTAGLITSAGPTAGLWGRTETATAAIEWTRYRLEGFWFPEVSGSATLAVGPADLLAYGGWRGAPTGSGLSTSTWGGGTVAFWFDQRTALVLSGGTYPSDLLQALPTGRYLSIGIRLAAERPGAGRPSATARRLLILEPGNDAISFRVPGARRVELAGDWTGWQRIPLTDTGGGNWRLPLRLPSGIYRFNLVADGDRWVVPPGVPTAEDGFGGKVGLLIVP